METVHRYKDAVPHLRRAVEIAEHRLGKDSPEIAWSLLQLGGVLHKLGLDRDAQDVFRRAVAIVSKDARLAQSFEPFARKTPLDMIPAVATAWRLALSSPDNMAKLRSEAFTWAQWGMQANAGKAIAQMAARFGSEEGSWSKLVREKQDLTIEWENADKRLIDAINADGQLRSEKAVARIRKERATLENRLEKLGASLKREFPAYFELASPSPLDIQEVQRLLAADEVLVLFLSGASEQTFVFAVTRNRASWKRIDLGSKAVADRVAALRKPIDDWARQGRGLARLSSDGCAPGKDGRGVKRIEAACKDDSRAFSTARAHELYRELLGPVEDVIKEQRHLILVASGPLTALPFHLLVTAPQGVGLLGHEALTQARWLIRRHAISVLPTVSALRALRVHAKESRASLPFLGFGDPNFQRGSESTRLVALRGISPYFRGRLADLDAIKGALAPLPDTATELRTIARMLGAAESDVVLQGKATESALKAMSADGRLARYRVVAFATHGLIAGEIKGLAEPAIVLSLPAKATEADDGFLTASEAAQLKLDADWVVLSACNTAAGDTPDAEALSGLARAFFFAGTRALLVSHWPVESSAAVKLTTQAFAALSVNPRLGRAEALRRSILTLIERGAPHEAHPAYWAPFVLVGEGGAADK
jgi:CHAT domain-containing protein